MMIYRMITIIFIFFVGVLAGYFFFGGLLWTVRKINHTKNPAILFLFSFLFRTAILLMLIYWIMADDWKCILPFLPGFAICRFFLIRYFNKNTLTI